MSYYQRHVFFCCNQRDGDRESCNPKGASELRDYAKAHHAQYADFHGAMADSQQGLPKELAADGVHPNLAGYKIMGPIVERAIAAALQQK